MLTACWSVKGGSGTTVVAVALAVLWSDTSPVLLADLGGDVPAALGLPEPTGPGLLEWLAAGPDVADGALERLALGGPPGVSVLPRGQAVSSSGGAAPRAADVERLAAALAAAPACVVDCGSRLDEAATVMAGAASLSLLVIRPCYLALRRALAAPIRPSGVVLVREDGRSLNRADVEDVLGVPVRAEVAWDPAVARAVDAGVLASRFPRGLERALRSAA